jgi:hypothetical protein
MLVRLARENRGQAPEALYKAVTVGGAVDEQPDIDGGKQAIALIAKLIGYEADELASGDFGEIRDIGMLCDAASTLKWWVQGEQASQEDQAPGCGCPPGCECCMGVVMASTDEDEAAKAKLSTADINDLPDSAFAYIEPGGTKDANGKTTPRSKRHFPVHDKAHADNAAARIAQGAEFGDKAKAKVEAAQRKFGESSDTSKSTVAEGEAGVQTEPEGTGGLSKAVEDAVTKATGPLAEAIKGLTERVAKVERLPVSGGPVLSAVRASARATGGDDWAAKAAYYREMAETVTDRQSADGYRRLAREADAKAAAPATA